MHRKHLPPTLYPRTRHRAAPWPADLVPYLYMYPKRGCYPGREEDASRQGDWVYINAPTGAAKRESPAYLEHFGLEAYGKGHEGLLFNLKEDPRQSDNLYAKYPERVKKMSELLQSYLDGKSCAPSESKKSIK